MMLVTPVILVLLGLLLGAWTLGAIVAILLGQAQRRGADAARAQARRLARMV